jgi:hypothetical protein
MNYSSAKTTLIYVNAAGKVASYDYGDLSLQRHENFKLMFDLSPATLPDGCIGLISLTNNNWSSTLTLTLGDVTLDKGDGSPYAATLSGDYVEDDSYVQEFISDAFRPARSFYADEIIFTTTVNGCRLLMLPFNAVIPEGAKAYTIGDDLTLTQMRSIPAHTPVLIEAEGEVVFTGQGEVGYFTSPLTDMFRGTYTPIPLYASDYLLDYQNGQWGFRRLDAPTTLGVFDVYAALNSQAAFVPIASDALSISTITSENEMPVKVFDLQGRQISAQPQKPGIYIKSGKKIVVK